MNNKSISDRELLAEIFISKKEMWKEEARHKVLSELRKEIEMLETYDKGDGRYYEDRLLIYKKQVLALLSAVSGREKVK